MIFLCVHVHDAAGGGSEGGRLVGRKILKRSGDTVVSGYVKDYNPPVDGKQESWTLRHEKKCDDGDGEGNNSGGEDEVVDRPELDKQLNLQAVMEREFPSVCNENKEEPVEHRWKWGIEEIAVVDQYTYLGVEIAKDCSWNAHMSKVAEKGKARAGKLHPILANRHLDTRIKLTVLKSVIVPPLEYAGEVWEGNKKVVKELEAAQMKAAKTILGCSRRTSNAAVRAELGIQSLRSGRDARKLTWQYRMCGMGEERLPRIVWEAKWANKKRGRQPTEWVKVVEDVWKGLDIDEDETLETEGLQGFKEKISVACAEREEQNLRKESKDKEGLEVYGMLCGKGYR
ncbi:unnamed protein product [Ectocarpus sp. CCAP 1310/34]|nr:unnamed protein product [Ectocarpus sp. CCAP 1310/34]